MRTLANSLLFLLHITFPCLAALAMQSLAAQDPDAERTIRSVAGRWEQSEHGTPLAHTLARINRNLFERSAHCDVFSSYRGPSDPWEFSRHGVQIFGPVTCGFCSQRSYWLADILRKQGIPAQLLGLEGHVVVAVPDMANGKHWILDPDYGVGPFKVELENSQAMQSAAADHYRFLVDQGKPGTLHSIVNAFATTEDNQFFTMSVVNQIRYRQAKVLKRLNDTLQDIFRTRRARFAPLSPLAADMISGSRVPLSPKASDLIPFRSEKSHHSYRPDFIRRQMDQFTAEAVHAALIAASVQLDGKAIPDRAIKLRPIDFVSASESPADNPGRNILLHNWGYKSAYLTFRRAGKGMCQLTEAENGPIRLTAGGSASIELAEDCAVARITVEP